MLTQDTTSPYLFHQWLDQITGYDRIAIDLVMSGRIVVLPDGAVIGRGGRILTSRSSYIQVPLGNKRNLGAHRLVYLCFVGPIPPGFEINHRDGDRRHNHPTNLEPLTHQGNIQHAYETGLASIDKAYCRGESHHTTKLTADTVREIRGLRTEGMGLRAIGERFGCTDGAVWRIVQRKNWRHI